AVEAVLRAAEPQQAGERVDAHREERPGGDQHHGEENRADYATRRPEGGLTHIPLLCPNRPLKGAGRESRPITDHVITGSRASAAPKASTGRPHMLVHACHYRRTGRRCTLLPVPCLIV